MAAYCDKDGRWRYRMVVTLPEGRKVRISGTAPAKRNTKAEAIGAERTHVAKLLNPQAHGPQGGGDTPTFSEVARDYMRDEAPQALSLSEQDSKRRKLIHLEQFRLPRTGVRFGDLPIGSIGKIHLDAIRGDLRERGLAMSTVNNNLAVIGAILTFAVDREIIARRPRMGLYKISRKHQPFEVYREPEVDQLLEDAGADIMLRCAILLGFDAGLRAGEIMSLHRVDVIGNVIIVRLSSYRKQLTPPKSGEARRVAMTQRLAVAVRQCLLAHAGPRVLARLYEGGGRWKDAHGEPWTYEVMRMRAPAKGWHALRHGFVTRLLDAGAPARHVQEVAGHVSLETTMRYSHPDEDAVAAVTSLLEGKKK